MFSSKNTLFILFFFVINSVLSQNENTISELFKIQKFVKIDSCEAGLFKHSTIASNSNSVGIVIPFYNTEDSITIKFVDYSTGLVSKETILFPLNLSFFSPTNPIKCFDFNDHLIVLCFMDGNNNYLCVFDRKTHDLLRILPTFIDIEQIELVGNDIFFALHYNTHPRKSSYKTFIGKIDWEKNQLVSFTTPQFDLIEFSHFNPCDWFDVNSQGFSVFSQTIDYRLQFYDAQLSELNSTTIESSNWVQNNISTAQKSLENVPKEQVKVIIDSLIPFHYKWNRIQNVDFLNDSTLIVSKIPENQKQSGLLRYYDFIRITQKDSVLTTKMLLENVKDEPIDEKSIISENQYDYILRNKPHLYENNRLVFLDAFYAPITLNKKKKFFTEQNDKAAAINDKKYIYVIISELDTDNLNKFTKK